MLPNLILGRKKTQHNKFIILCIRIFILGYDSLRTYSQLHLQALCNRQNSILIVVFGTVCQITSTTDVSNTDNQQRTMFHVLWSWYSLLHHLSFTKNKTENPKPTKHPQQGRLVFCLGISELWRIQVKYMAITQYRWLYKTENWMTDPPWLNRYNRSWKLCICTHILILHKGLYRYKP